MAAKEPFQPLGAPALGALSIARVASPLAGPGNAQPGPGTGTRPAAVVPAPDFAACQAMREDHELELWGNLDRCLTLPEALEYWRGTDYEERHLFLARLDGQPLGLCSVTLPLRENTARAGIDVLVGPHFRRRGYGRALLEHAESLARGRGRTSLDAYHEVPLGLVQPGSVMVPAKSGAGGLPLNDLATAFAMAAGYELEQVERSSTLSLPVPPDLLAGLEAEALAKAGDYELTGWDEECPADLLPGYAELKARMSEDVPTAGLDWEREAWDPAQCGRRSRPWYAVACNP
ncbi:GNAT family N-acetyltransferase [Arthrobacter sp. MPF02]|uniref:GNAT family N-acetyltransferase n=1 Tax=Arthrobacter sp. MPF02 TaxID=3388492 RepID=UPI003985500C